VFEEIFQKCYRPYFEVLDRFPHLKTAAHFTGPLLEWIKDHHPEYLSHLKEMVSAGRLEILSGGFYEPLLSTLPEEDAIGQIQMMNRFIREEFGCIPRGLWLAERIWTPDLPRIIAAAGIEYTVIDDTHFYYSGLEEREIHGYFVTEKQGRPLRVFPLIKALRYAIPFKLPHETIDYLRRARDEFGFAGVTYADDGEKFGSWPETYKWVYEEEWLSRFFSALEENRGWIETLTFGEYLDRHSPTGRIYLPMASYDEMMEWSLPTRANRRFHQLKVELKERGIEEEHYKVFLRGGQWDNFLTKYEEANNIHKKILHVSRKVKRLPLQEQESSGALRELYRGQCNCAQWHGLFGGLYLNYLRHALYHHLIAAENRVDARRDETFSLEVFDYNLDGREEVIVSQPTLNAYLAPACGGSLFELDYRPACFNLSNVLARREETYHQTIREALQGGNGPEGQPQSIHDIVKFKEQNLQAHLFYDRWPRYSFLDHFLAPQTPFAEFREGRFEPWGDFAGADYALVSTPGPADPNPAVLLRRSGRLGAPDTPVPATVEKKYIFSRNQAEMRVEYQVRNDGSAPVALRFGVEFNFTLLAGDAEDRFYFCPGKTLDANRMNSMGELEGVETIGLRDSWHKFQLTLSFNPSTRLWRFPVETVSQSEDGFERTYQGSCLLAHWPLDLAPGATARFAIRLQMAS